MGAANEVLASFESQFALLEGIVARQAQLIAKWMLIGFIHGVMNTDNTSISGETIDYGPCAFMEAYDPAAVFSSIDHGGRYAYGNQPRAALWNLARLAEALLPFWRRNQRARRARWERPTKYSHLSSLSLRRPALQACAASLGCTRSAKGMRIWPTTCCSAWLRTALTSP